ncbi:hypothetical protein H9Y04_02740 [Streptomyces sp. TRM66268-LWL]|uniref:Uncharacterized protein n=1 Tax=Streptomyces polyasparticus TaxID=2767826 RepID=A0ABR7S9C6_9ACTN|nr:hypothetical protein [Streptomyces polyasparticus]MBC9711489.1 hypothetical protein [Streptomyces polyasparticus]
MRSTLLAKKSLVAAALGAFLLTGPGAQHATAAPAGAVTVTDDAEFRFLELADLIAQSCSLSFPTATSGTAVTSTATSGTAVTSTATSGTALTSTVDPVALTWDEECAAQRHRSRIHKAFSGTDLASYEALRDKLTTLRYPAARIHRMPDFSGEPVVRIDLRVGAGHLAVQVTGIGNGVMVEAFGAPEGVSVTDVRLEREVDWPSS